MAECDYCGESDHTEDSCLAKQVAGRGDDFIQTNGEIGVGRLLDDRSQLEAELQRLKAGMEVVRGMLVQSLGVGSAKPVVLQYLEDLLGMPRNVIDAEDLIQAERIYLRLCKGRRFVQLHVCNEDLPHPLSWLVEGMRLRLAQAERDSNEFGERTDHGVEQGAGVS